MRLRRRERLRVLFGGTVPETTHGFLLDHTAALAGLAAAGHTLLLDDGHPACRFADELLRLDDRAAVAAAHERARGPFAATPFCFVILQYNKPEVTARCVESLRRIESGGRPVHAIIVDNGSEPAAVARSHALFDGAEDVTLVCTGENLGFARGNNVGYRHARDVLGADFTKQVSRDYDVLIEDKGIALRGLFIIDPDGVLQYKVVHALNIGRSVDETLRVLQALQEGGLCPADWKPGQKKLTPA